MDHKHASFQTVVNSSSQIYKKLSTLIWCYFTVIQFLLPEVLISYFYFLLGFSKGNARVEISASFFFFFFFFVQPQFAILYLMRMREDFTDMARCNGGRRRVYAVEDQHSYCVRIQNGYKMCTQRSR